MSCILRVVGKELNVEELLAIDSNIDTYWKKGEPKLKTIILIVSMFASIFALWSIPKVVFYFEVDKCLDSGGSYNYNQCECDYQSDHEFKEYHECH